MYNIIIQLTNNKTKLKVTIPSKKYDRFLERGSKFLGSGLNYEKKDFNIYEKVSLKGSPSHLAEEARNKKLYQQNQ